MYGLPIDNPLKVARLKLFLPENIDATFKGVIDKLRAHIIDTRIVDNDRKRAHP